MKNFDDPDAFDEALAITKESVDEQVGAIDTVYQENRALEAEIERLLAQRSGLTAKVDELRNDIERLREWKQTAENLMGQRGVENISAMLNIIEAAIKWEQWMRDGAVYSAELNARKRLREAVNAYEDMVARRALEGGGD